MREGIEDAGGAMGKINKDAYSRYLEMGGIINEKDYENALDKNFEPSKAAQEAALTADLIAKHAGIELKHGPKMADGFEDPDPRAKLFAVLRGDKKPPNVSDHHSQMSDQRLFAEVLRMSGDKDSLDKLKSSCHKNGIYCPVCLKVVGPENKCE